MEKLKEYSRFDQLLEWASDAYEYDQESLKANTDKDKLRHKNLEKLEGMKEMIKLNETNNENPTETVPEVMPQPQG